MNQAELDRRLYEIQQTAYDRIPSYRRRLNAAVTRAKEDIARIVAKHARGGVFPRARINAAKLEIEEVMRRLAKDLEEETEYVAADIAETSSAAMSVALLMVTGLSAVAAAETAAAAPLLLLGLGGITLASFSETIVELLFDRSGLDDFVLSDRFRVLTESLAQEVVSTLRATIANSEEIDNIPGLIEQAFESDEWKLDRILETEASYALRESISEAARNSELVEALKIIDFPHGRYHDKHECYKLARRDEFGLGLGVYPIGDERVLMPHPQCRSRLLLILREGVANA